MYPEQSTRHTINTQEILGEDFPGGPAVGNPPASAGDMSAVSGLGGLHMLWSNKAHAAQLLSLGATTTEAQVP